MVSILIPIYNYNGIKLVTDLQQQGQALDVPYEIILVDDGSPNPQKEHESLWELDNVKYLYLAENKGRSAVRNWLAEQARYPYLLFIDGDMGVVSDDYLQRYVATLSGKKVICGGHCYSNKAPQEKELFLHWHYGRSREQQQAQIRNRRPYRGFVPSNFVIPKTIFDAIRFDETITGYGHEDTLFGELLRKQSTTLGFNLVHIDNELEHLGLAKAEEFLSKTERAVQNLVLLEKKHGFTATKLQETAHSLSWSKSIIRLLAPKKSFLRKQIIKTGSLKLLDLYKLLLYFG